MMRYKILFAILFIPVYLQAQEGKCGTQITSEQIVLESGINLPSLKPNESLPQLSTELSVTVYVIKDQDGMAGISAAAIQSAIDRVNTAFLPIGLKFRICNTIYIDNYQFNTISANNEKNLLIQHYSKNTINLYFAGTVTDRTGAPVSGYTMMPAELKDAVFMDKDNINSNDIIHQFGHFFNLYHTHETVFGKELVRDANCNKTGDKCCDTPADPGLGGLIDNKCDYTGNLKDAANKFYIPSTNNFMSTGNDVCRCFFSNDQFNRIIHSVLNHKKHLW